MKDKSVFSSAAIIIGTTIGAGIFGLPYVFMKAGFIIGLLYLLFFGVISVFILKAYSEVVLRTRERSQIIGYASRYLGQRGRYIALISFLFGITGALIAYTIQVGSFLETVFSSSIGGNAFSYGLIFFGLGSLVILSGLKYVTRLGKVLVVILIILVIVIIVSGLPHVDIDNLTTINPVFFFLPYGVVLFALSAASAIPDASENLLDKKKLYRIINYCVAIPLVIYLVFSFVVVGVSGQATSEGAIGGLVNYLGNGVVIIGALLGIMTMSTSFLCLGLVIKEIYQYDLKLPKLLAWIVALTPPLVVYLFQLTTFITIISLVGAIMGGFDGIIVLLMWRRAKKIGKRKPECQINVPVWAQALMVSILSLGIIYEIFYQITT
ncbi:MAG: aromatic amino acid transport family protein [Patescibacteria group bacterium]|nr:aromatic amino acid transport family protein [Patescibacteria group bacterium]